MNNYIHLKQWDGITHPRSSLTGGLCKSQLKIGYVWVIQNIYVIYMDICQCSWGGFDFVGDIWWNFIAIAWSIPVKLFTKTANNTSWDEHVVIMTKCSLIVAFRYRRCFSVQLISTNHHKWSQAISTCPGAYQTVPSDQTCCQTPTRHVFLELC